MLKHRILTALILIPLVVSGVLFLPTFYIKLIFGAVILLSAWEWQKLSFSNPLLGYSFLLVVAGSLLTADALLVNQSVITIVMMFAIAWWLLQVLHVFRYRSAEGIRRLSLPMAFLNGLLLLVPAWIAVVELHAIHQEGPGLLLLILVSIWCADSGAYFTGKSFGRHKLAPKVSPGKTWEGLAGGLLSAAIFAGIAYYLFEFNLPGILSLVGLVTLAMIFSVFGDLYESTIKRDAQQKDSGSLLPGHGGILDRIDSLLAASPVFYSGILLLREDIPLI